MKTVLSIAGSDCSGGAGIQADIKTIAAHNMYAMTVITALTAQNTTGVYWVIDTPPDFMGKQIDCIFTDIPPDAVKIGMVSTVEIIECVAERLKFYGAENIVVDPVMVSTAGSRLLSESAINALTTELLPLGKILTPNIPEAQVLTGLSIETREEMSLAAAKLGKMFHSAILIKGGHLVDSADDLLLVDNREKWFQAERILNPNTHGTGCTLSSAIACNLAGNSPMEQAVSRGKAFVLGAIKNGMDLGKGPGPLNHCYSNNFRL